MAEENDGDVPDLLRTLVYGPGKTKKTWWACRCAEFGYNVILLDGDDGSVITKQLPAEAQKRITIIKLMSKIDGSATFCRFMASFLKARNNLIWNARDRIETYSKTAEPYRRVWVDAAKLTPNDVLIVDSWTALAESLRQDYATTNKIDLSDAKKTEWDGFGFEGGFLDFVLMKLHALPCHVIVVGHATVYEKWDRRDKKNPILLEQRTQPISSSGPHAKKLAKHFDNVLYFERFSPTSVYIDPCGDRDKDGGSRLIEPVKQKWEDLTPAVLFKALGQKSTGAPCEGAKVYLPGVAINPAAIVQAAASAAPQAPEQPRAPAPVIGKPGGFLSKLKMEGKVTTP